MENEIGICRRCGKNLLTDYGDLDSKYRNNVCSAGNVMANAIEGSKQSIPEYCPRCHKENRKDKIQKVLSFFKK